MAKIVSGKTTDGNQNVGGILYISGNREGGQVYAIVPLDEKEKKLYFVRSETIKIIGEYNPEKEGLEPLRDVNSQYSGTINFYPADDITVIGLCKEQVFEQTRSDKERINCIISFVNNYNCGIVIHSDSKCALLNRIGEFIGYFNKELLIYMISNKQIDPKTIINPDDEVRKHFKEFENLDEFKGIEQEFSRIAYFFEQGDFYVSSNMGCKHTTLGEASGAYYGQKTRQVCKDFIIDMCPPLVRLISGGKQVNGYLIMNGYDFLNDNIIFVPESAFDGGRIDINEVVSGINLNDIEILDKNENGILDLVKYDFTLDRTSFYDSKAEDYYYTKNFSGRFLNSDEVNALIKKASQSYSAR